MSTDYRFGNAELRPAQRQLLVGGKERHIGARAFDLLLALVEHRDRIVDKNELLDSVWSGLVVEENNLQVHISSLRKVLGPKAIATIPGRGYRFTADLDDASPHGPDAPPVPVIPAPREREAQPVLLSNLPAELPALYGRDKDVPALCALVEARRVVTVVGASGIGKTALAQEVAHQLRGSFSDGVWLVELSPVGSPSLVATTAARVLHVTLGAEAQSETLARAVSTSRMLVVLDNCEQVADGAAELADAFYRCAPQVKVLATSQERLKVAQEHVFRLGALAVPSDDSMDSARQAGAVALFHARASAADPGFALGPHNRAGVVDICRHLDGIPLAIELAAARVPLLGVDGLRTRLDHRFRVLTGGSRLAQRRHQTLHAALDWSYGLLNADEQAVFRRLGVFAGSFGMDSAQRVASAAGIDAWAVLDHLGALVDKSLANVEQGDEPRYHLLETSRTFALEKLRETGETEHIMRNHAHAVLAVFEASRKNEYLLPRQALLDRYLPDLDNARAALDWSAGSDAQLHVALAGACAWLWGLAGLRPEGMRRMELAIALIDDATPTHLEARLLGSWSHLAWPQVGPLECERQSRAIELYRRTGDPQGLYCALCELGRTLAAPSAAARFESIVEEAKRLFDSAWPPAMRGLLFAAHGCWLFRQGRFEESITAYEKLLQLATDLGDRRLALTALVSQEQAQAGLEHWGESVARGRAMLELLRQDRALRSGIEIFVLGNLCMSLMELGEIEEALEVAHRAWLLHQQAGNTLCILDPLARLAFERRRIEDAARIVGRADMRYAANPDERQLVEVKLHDKLLAALRDALPAAELARLMKDGEGLSDEEAARLALRD